MSNESDKKSRYIGVGIIVGVLIMCLFLIDINSELSKLVLYRNLKINIKFIVKVISTALPLLIIMIIFLVYKFFNKKWIFRVEKLNLGGVNIICDNPDTLFSQQVKNFLNTKRTLFKIDVNNDNFHDTLKSYYDVYNFLREEMKIFDPKTAKVSKYYEIANDMIQVLNTFLTAHQSNYRRWYEYIEKKNLDDIYNKDICEVQKEYRNYVPMVEDFKSLNEFFCSVAAQFEIDTNKWINK